MRDMKKLYNILLIAIFLMVGVAHSVAQSDRNFIREGNRAFKAQKWTAAETQYRKAISKNGKNPQAVYNLGCALLMQQKDSAAMQQFQNAAQLESNKFRRSKSYHNMGVIMQNHRDYANAISCYEQSLRLNPQDNETRYNLALCKKLLKNNKQNKNQNKNNKDKNNKDKNNKNKDKNKQNQDKNKNDKNKDQNKDKNDQNKDKNQDKNKQNQNKNQQNQDKMSRDNAEQLLNAAVQQEQATKQKLQKAMSQPRRKAYDKNW